MSVTTMRQFRSIHSSIYQTIVFIVIILIASYSLLRPGMFAVHDFLHTARIAEMARGLLDGQFPVIWSQNFSYGYGMPLFEFYSPLPYLIGGFLLLTVSDLLLATKLFWLLPTIIIASGTFVLVKKLLGSSWLALTSTALVTLAPYRAVQLYIRGSLAEAWAMSWYVWLLVGLTMLVRKERYGGLLVLISGISLVLSHNISVLLILIPTILFWFGLSYETLHVAHQRSLRDRLLEIGKQILPIVVIVTLVLGLTAFYTVPSILEKNFTKVDQYVLADYFAYTNHFVYIRQLIIPNWGYGGSEWGPNDKISFYLGSTQLILIGLACLLGLLRILKKTSIRRPYVFISLLLCLFLTLFLATGRSNLIWDQLFVLKYIQFPWRFLGLVVLFAGVVGVWPLTKLSIRWQTSAALIVIFLTVIPAMTYFRPESSNDVTQQYYVSQPTEISQRLSQYLPDYEYHQLFNQVNQNPYPRCIDTTNFATVETCSLVQQVIKSNYQKWLISSQEPVALILPIANYPGWKLTVDGIPTIQSEVEGKIAVELSPGTHILEVLFTSTPVRSLGLIISLSTLVLLLLILLIQQFKFKSK